MSVKTQRKRSVAKSSAQSKQQGKTEVKRGKKAVKSRKSKKATDRTRKSKVETQKAYLESAIADAISENDLVWDEIRSYIDESDSFEVHQWIRIREYVDSGKLNFERIIAKAVIDKLPEKYGMTMGDFFGKFWGLEQYTVSKLCKRHKTRSMLAEYGLDVENAKDALLDKVSSFIGKGFPQSQLAWLLEELIEENNFELPTVIKFESRVTGFLAERSSLSELESEELEIAEMFESDIETPDSSSPTKLSRPESYNSVLQKVLENLEDTTKLLQSLSKEKS